MTEPTERPRSPRTKVTGPQGRLPDQALPLPAPAPFGSWAERRIARARLNTTGDEGLDQEIRDALVQVAAEADRLWDGIARRSKGPADDPDLRAEIIAMIRSLEGVWARERHEAVDEKWARRSAARAAAWGAAAAALEQLDPLLADQLPGVVTVAPIAPFIPPAIEKVPEPVAAPAKQAAKTPVKTPAKRAGAKAPVAKRAVAKKPIAKRPVAKRPAAKRPIAKKPAAKAPAKKPIAKRPVAKKPAVKKPVAKAPAKKLATKSARAAGRSVAAKTAPSRTKKAVAEKRPQAKAATTTRLGRALRAIRSGR